MSTMRLASTSRLRACRVPEHVAPVIVGMACPASEPDNAVLLPTRADTLPGISRIAVPACLRSTPSVAVIECLFEYHALRSTTSSGGRDGDTQDASGDQHPFIVGDKSSEAAAE
jgi:hypothetical protein